MVTKWKSIGFMGSPKLEQKEGFSAKLWSIDITGYNERRLNTKTDTSDPSWSSLLSRDIFYVNYT